MHTTIVSFFYLFFVTPEKQNKEAAVHSDCGPFA